MKIRMPFPSDDGCIAETPWAEVVGAKDSGRVLGRVTNHLVYTDLHGYEFGDIVELEETWLGPDYGLIWQVVGKIQ